MLSRTVPLALLAILAVGSNPLLQAGDDPLPAADDPLPAATIEVESEAAADEAPQQPSPEQIEQMMAALRKVGPEHKRLAKMVGEWEAVTEMYQPGMEKPVSKDQATSVCKMVMGGRYLQEEFTGTFGGEKFMGRGMTGYDNAQKKYVGTWIDNFGTGFLLSEGTYDAETKTETLLGKMVSPMGELKMKMVTKHIDDDHRVMTMYNVLPTGPQKSMVIHYTRKK